MGRGLAFFLLCAGCTSTRASDGNGGCAGGDGLEVTIQYVGVGDACSSISVPENVGIEVQLDGVILQRPDAIEASVDRALFEWPAGVADGSAGSVTVYATGEGVVADGASNFSAHPATCQNVVVAAECREATLDGGP
jgi:hypothetical protein